MKRGAQEIRFILTKCSSKEAKKKYSQDSTFFIIDIGKIIRDLGYSVESLTSESEFVINYTVQRKIIQGIYSTKTQDILVVYKNISSSFIDNLKYFLDCEMEEKIDYTIEIEEK